MSVVSSLPTRDRLILALDTPSLPEALAWVDRLPEVLWWKVGLELFTAVGPAILQELRHRQKRIFLDLKLHDIPNTVAGATRAAVAHGVDFLTIHASGGIPMLKAAAESTQGSSCRLLAVTLLTSIAPTQLHQELGVDRSVPDYVKQLAWQAQSVGIPGAVCSPQEVADLRGQCGSDFVLITPGIRLERVKGDDQARLWTPQAAFAAGADWLVVGRPITRAPDPVQEWHRWCEVLQKGEGLQKGEILQKGKEDDRAAP